MNILIVKLSAVGDVVHTLPALAALRKLYPQAHITWIIEEAAADLIACHPYLDRLIVSRRKKWARDLKRFQNIRKTFREIKAIVWTVRDRNYDIVIDFHGLLKSSVFVMLASAHRKLGFRSLQELSGIFVNERIPEDLNKHAVDRYLDFLRYLGYNEQQPEFFIPITAENRQRVESLLRANKVDKDAPLIAINPVAFWDTKLWDNASFALLCDRISQELQAKVILTGSNQAGILGDIQALTMNPVINLGGLTTLRDLACLYRLAALVVSTDSGPMHIAAAAGTPTVALFGPTDPRRTGPYGQRHTVIRKNIACSPCFRKQCTERTCMHAITVEEVFKAVKMILEEKKS